MSTQPGFIKFQNNYIPISNIRRIIFNDTPSCEIITYKGSDFSSHDQNECNRLKSVIDQFSIKPSNS